MMRCPTCGRLLAGLRYDHPLLCRLARGEVPAAPRIQIREGEPGDPFEESGSVVAEGRLRSAV